MNVGEEICGEWLRHVKGCEFIEYDLKIDGGGDVDVIGIDVDRQKVFVCEVAIHLITGIQYVNPQTRRPDNTNRFTKKFEKDVDYIRNHFPDHDYHFMLWSPVVKNQKKGTKYNQAQSLQEVVENLRASRGVEIELVINEVYSEKINDLRQVARKESKELSSSVMRVFQIEEKLLGHLNRLKNS